MKKIAIFMPYVTGMGGTETVVRNIFEMYNLDKTEEIELKLFLIGGSENKVWLNEINYEEIQLSKNRRLRKLQYVFLLFWILKSNIKKYSPDLVISTNPVMCYLIKIIQSLGLYHFQTVAWIHYSLVQKKFPYFLIKKSNYQLAISTGIAEQLLDIGIPREKVRIISNPIPEIEQIIRRPQEKKKFIYIGRINFLGQKNLKELLDAVNLLYGSWSLDVYGDGDDLDRCIMYANSIGVQQNINWHGFISNPWKDIDEATALVLTSTYEGFGMVLGEAISRGLYVVSSDCDTGPRDIVKPDKNGSLYKPGEVKKLAEILQGILDEKFKLPDQYEMKKSIDNLYSQNYYSNLKEVLLKME